MKITPQTLFRLAALIALVTGILVLSVPLAWAGTGGGDGGSTIPTSQPGALWTFFTNAKNCPVACLQTVVDVSSVAPAPRGITFKSASTLSGFAKGFLRYTVRVCYQTTDRLDRIYYYETALKPSRWVRLIVTVRSPTQVCTNVRFANATFAVGH